MPQYQTYTKKAKFTEVVQAAQGFKSQVEICIQNRENPADTTVTGCGNGSGGVAASPSPYGKVDSVTVSTAGVITAKGTTAAFGTAYEYVMQPSVTASGITWNTTTGSCVGAGLC
ncbi:pilin [Zoogloea sp.]|uniref:pilin n=1 Tax=Zoogloea sp. TaxID=49181 RepID=UPI0031FD675C